MFLFVTKAFKTRPCKFANNSGAGNTLCSVQGRALANHSWSMMITGRKGMGPGKGGDSIKVRCALTKHFGWFCARKPFLLCGTKHKTCFCLFQYMDQKALEKHSFHSDVEKDENLNTAT